MPDNGGDTTTMVIQASLNDKIKSVHEQILFLTKIPVTRQKLVYMGEELQWSKTLAHYSIKNDDLLHLESCSLESTIWTVSKIPIATQKFLNEHQKGNYPFRFVPLSDEQKQTMDHLQRWKQVDELVLLVCEMCKRSRNSKEKLLSYLSKVLDKPKQHDLQILVISSVPATLFMLCKSDSPVHQQISHEMFQSFLDHIVPLPQQVHIDCASVLLDSCHLLVNVADMKDLYRAYRKAVRMLIFGNRDSIFFDSLEECVKAILPIFCELADSVCTILLDPFSSCNLPSAGETEETLIWLLKQEFDDFKACK